ncbi:MAG: type II toxin-antitoxin system VapB family antitoxin [Pseudonocardia sp.]|nr:type II toxin-antitoxin system VapB family antitoxin [Pseudonocardia sp.]
MAKTVVDLDDELLAEAARVLGTTTKKDTVNRALAELVGRRRRQDLVEWLGSDPLPDLRDPGVLEQAWR